MSFGGCMPLWLRKFSFLRPENALNVQIYKYLWVLGVACLLAWEKLAFCDLKMLNFRPYFSLNEYISIHNDFGGCTTACLRKFCILVRYTSFISGCFFFLNLNVYVISMISRQGRIQPLERGGGKLLTEHGGPRGWLPGGVLGDEASWQGLQGGSAPLPREILHFWAQFARFGAYFLRTWSWKPLDLFPIKMLFFLIMVGLYENGSFILLTLVPPRVPHIAGLHIILSLQVFCCPNLFF